MPRAWRILKGIYADRAFSGEGSRLYGSRWTSPGQSVAFAAESLSLAVLEVLVDLRSSVALADYVVFTVDFPATLLEELDRSTLPPNWRDNPPPPEDQDLGDVWIRRVASALLRVPSVVIPHENYFLINPAHGDFARLVIQGPFPLDIDSRFLGRST